MENAWQFAKVYSDHIRDDGDPSKAYYKWAQEGWGAKRARRYPMGKDRKAEYCWWAGEKLDYVEARKKVYLPLYAHGVNRTRAFKRLLNLYQTLGAVTLWDFDGYDHRAAGMSLRDVVNDPDRSMGHAFVLMMLLEKATG
jgi:hypothetical protein